MNNESPMIGKMIIVGGKKGQIISEVWIPRAWGGYYVCRCTGYVVMFLDKTAKTIKPEDIEMFSE